MTVLIIISHLILYYFLFEKAEQLFYKNLHWLWVIIPLLFIFLDIFIIIRQVIRKNHEQLFGTLFLILCIPVFILLGHYSWKKAFNDCIENSEIVRTELLNYQKINAQYPSIKDNFPIRLCGKRFLNGPLMQYEQTTTGFKIFFSDNFVTYIGTESTEVTAYK